MNVRFLNKVWKITVEDAREGVVVFAWSDRYGVGVLETIPSEDWQNTPEEHRNVMLKSLACLSLISQASNISRLVNEIDEAELPDNSTRFAA